MLSSAVTELEKLRHKLNNQCKLLRRRRICLSYYRDKYNNVMMIEIVREVVGIFVVVVLHVAVLVSL